MSVSVNIPGKSIVSLNDPGTRYNPINNVFFEKSKYSHNNNLKYNGIKSQLDCENSCLNNVDCKNYSLYYPNNVQNTNYNNRYDCYLSNSKQLDGIFTNLINDKNYKGGFDKIDIDIIKKIIKITY